MKIPIIYALRGEKTKLALCGRLFDDTSKLPRELKTDFGGSFSFVIGTAYIGIYFSG
jgi:hypothetical protein